MTTPEDERVRAGLQLQSKALKYDLDQLGIESRTRDAVELVELRADLAAYRQTAPTDERLRWAWKTVGEVNHPQREHAIILLEAFVGRHFGFGADKDQA